MFLCFYTQTINNTHNNVNTIFNMNTFPGIDQEVSWIILDCDWEFKLRKQNKSRV